MRGDYFVFSVALAIFAWNWFAPPGEAVTDTLRRGALWSPIVPFLFGVLCGHAFWNR